MPVMQFHITGEEASKIFNWQIKHDKKCKIPHTAIAGKYSFCFTPTSVGTSASVRCICGKRKCFREVEDLDTPAQKRNGLGMITLIRKKS